MRRAIVIAVAVVLVLAGSPFAIGATTASNAPSRDSLARISRELTAADLASAAPIPVLVELEAPPAARAELADRARGVAWTVGDRVEANAAVVAGQDDVVDRIRAAGVEVTIASADVLGPAGQRIESEARLTYLINGFRTIVPGTSIREIAAVDGVSAIWDDRPKEMLQLNRSSSFVQADEVAAAPADGGFGTDGSGKVIAVLDTGIDHEHPMFGTFDGDIPAPAGPGDGCNGDSPAESCSSTHPKVIYAEAGELAGAGGLSDDNGHGTHVASTAAGLPTEAPVGSVTGVAPGASLMAFKVLGASGSGVNTEVIAAMEEAVQETADHPRADVVNMSLGSSGNDPDTPTARAADTGVDLGVVFAIAAGNDGEAGRGSLGSPGGSRKSITVGNAGDPWVGPWQLTGEGVETTPAYIANSLDRLGNPVAAPVTDEFADCGGADTPPFCPAGTDGRIALVYVAETTTRAYETVKLAVEAQADPSAIVFITDSTGASLATAPEQPVFLASVATGAALRNLTDSETRLSSTTITLEPAADEDYDNVLNASSSEGPASDYTIKPDVVAPGTFIYAARSQYCTSTCTPAYGTTEGEYLIISGTSMAAPHVAGASALILAARPEWTPSMVKAGLAATGLYLGDEKASVNQQGGGSIRTLAALQSPALLTPTQLSFGEVGTPEGQGRVLFRQLTFTATEAATAPITYELGVRNGILLPNEGFSASFRAADDPTAAIDRVTVAPGDEARVLVRIEIDPELPVNDPDEIYEGYELWVEATPASAAPPLHIPVFYRHVHDGAAPASERPVLHPLGDGTEDGRYTLTWDRVSDGASSYRVEEATSSSRLLFDDAEGTESPSDQPWWENDGGWTSSSDENHTAGGSTSYFSGQGSNLHNALLSAPLDAPSTVRFWELVDTEPDFDFARVYAHTAEGAVEVYETTGASDGWREVTLDLPRGTTRVEFVYETDELVDSFFHAGWYVDDVSVDSTPFEVIGETSAGSFSVTDRPAGAYAYRVLPVRPGVGDEPVAGRSSNVEKRIVSSIGAPASVNAGEIVNLIAHPSIEGATYAWTVGGRSFSGRAVATRLEDPGNVPVELLITTSDDLRATASRTIKVSAHLESGDGGDGDEGSPVDDPTDRAGSVGYALLGADGGVFTFGDAAFHGSTGAMRLNQPVIGMAWTPTGAGYWLVARDGGIFTFGDAAFFGSTGNLRLNAPVLGMEPTPTGRGYWLFAADGGIFTFGDARFFGSTGNMRLNAPAVGMAATPTGGGYWLVARDGGIFTFGDAAFFGSTGNLRLNEPVFDMAPTSSGRGYWLVARDGGVFTFGDARFFGSTGDLGIDDVVGMVATRSGGGYWIADASGFVAGFGDAPDLGDLSDVQLNSAIVGFAAAQ